MAEEQDPLTAARETLAGMTPGWWRVIETFGAFTHIFAKGLDGLDYVVANCRAHLTFKTSSSPERDAANAAGIVLSVSIARALTDEATVEAVARAARKRRFERSAPASAYDAEIPPTENEIDDARAVILAILTHAKEAGS